AAAAGDSAASDLLGDNILRSEDPPMSIDLTFHMLRNMIHMAKMEGEREQAQINRNLLDEV
uniref:UI (Fragments) n=1 Tax=Platichthys flesus TaxID=8260 RepID=UTS1_PLAFE|nr:RecName: Full=UI; Contains: RecName: Full=Urophysin; Contains: RecName: Full=Urotensin-1; AltName: Full=Urotensin I; Flags: Precursor [Platichthys flesus]